MKSHTEDPKILGAAFQNIIARDAQHPRFVLPCTIMLTARRFTSVTSFGRIKEKYI
jgi:hypothetical protein